MLSKGATGYTYNTMNQLTRVGAGDDYTYDPNGNLVGRESGADTWAYVWDSDNRLVSAARNGTIQRRYSYDAGGRRVMSYGGASGNMLYAYLGLSVVNEAPVGGGDSTLRFYSGMLQVAEKTGATVEYLHQDHLGSTRLVTNSTGGIVFSDNYQPFGVDSGKSGSEEFRYTGKPSDDLTGLYYFGARYYLPEIGRFITEDIIIGDLTEPQSLNRYTYCTNNPMKYVDLNGYWKGTLGGSFGYSGGAGVGVSGKIGVGLFFGQNDSGEYKTGIYLKLSGTFWGKRSDEPIIIGVKESVTFDASYSHEGSPDGRGGESTTSTATITWEPVTVGGGIGYPSKNGIPDTQKPWTISGSIGPGAGWCFTGGDSTSYTVQLPFNDVKILINTVSAKLFTPQLPSKNEYWDACNRPFLNTSIVKNEYVDPCNRP